MWICRSVAHLDSRNEGQLHPYESYSDGMQICQQKPPSYSAMGWIGLSPFDIARLQGNSVGAGSQNSDCSWVCGSYWTDGWLTITLTMLSRFSSSSTTEIIEYSPAGEMQRVASTTRVPEDCLYRLHRILGCNLTTQICCPALA